MKSELTTALPNYYSFLLRLWRAGNGKHPAWRATLRNVRSGVQYTFADLIDLAVFLNERRWESGAVDSNLPEHDTY